MTLLSAYKAVDPSYHRGTQVLSEEAADQIQNEFSEGFLKIVKRLQASDEQLAHSGNKASKDIFEKVVLDLVGRSGNWTLFKNSIAYILESENFGLSDLEKTAFRSTVGLLVTSHYAYDSYPSVFDGLLSEIDQQYPDFAPNLMREHIR